MGKLYKLKELYKKIVVNRFYCFDFAIRWTGIFFTIWGIITLFTPSDNLIDSELAWGIRLLLAVLIVTAIFVLVYIAGIIIVLKTNQITMLDVGNNHHVYVQYGDVLSPDIIGGSISTKRRNILIAVNRCFDTIIDDDLISSNSLHGQAMRNLYVTGEYTEETLNAQIQKRLADQPFKSINRNNKPKGNLKRYEEGADAESESSSGCTFFFLGLTAFDDRLHPYISDVEYGVSLVKALQYCIDRNQGYPVLVPLIGGGRAQTHKEERDILEYIIKLIQLNKAAINCDIHIVVRESAKGSIPISGLKTSL